VVDANRQYESKAEENVNVTDESRSSWYSSWNGTGGSSDDGGRWRQTLLSVIVCGQCGFAAN